MIARGELALCAEREKLGGRKGLRETILQVSGSSRKSQERR